MKISRTDFMQLTIQEVSDMLMEDIITNNKKESTALLIGRGPDKKEYKLKVRLSL